MSCQKFYNAKTFTGVYFFLISIYKSKLTCIQFQDVLSFFFTWFALRTIKFCLKFSKLCPKVFFTEIFLPKLLKILYLKKNPNNWINIFYSRTEPVTSWKFAITWVNWFQQNYYRFSKINLNCKSNWLIFYQGAYFIFFFFLAATTTGENITIDATESPSYTELLPKKGTIIIFIWVSKQKIN